MAPAFLADPIGALARQKQILNEGGGGKKKKREGKEERRITGGERTPLTTNNSLASGRPYKAAPVGA